MSPTFTREEIVYLHELIKINKANEEFTRAFGTFGMKHIESVERKIKQVFEQRFGVTLTDEVAEG